jgi:uncharacterized membrane protein YccC
VTAVSLAATAVLIVWGVGHRHDYYPAADVAIWAVIGLFAAVVAWRQRRALIRQESADACEAEDLPSNELPSAAVNAPTPAEAKEDSHL